MRDTPGFDGVIAFAGTRIGVLRFAGLVLNLDGCLLARTDGGDIPLTRGEFALY